METVAWTDERLDERLARIDERFDHVEAGLKEVKEEIKGLRREINDLREALLSLHTTMHRGNLATIAGLVGVIGAILVKGG